MLDLIIAISLLALFLFYFKLKTLNKKTIYITILFIIILVLKQFHEFNIFSSFVSLIIGLLFLIKGSDDIVDSSIIFSNKLKIPKIIIGLSLVAIGTSLPELIVTVKSVLITNSSTGFDLSLGNIIGSNIANIFLIIGLSTLFLPILIKKKTKIFEIPYVVFCAFLLLLFSKFTLFSITNEFKITRFEGIIFLLLGTIFFLYLTYSFKKSRQLKKYIKEEEDVLTEQINIISYTQEKTKNNWEVILFFIIGIIELYFGGELVINRAVFLAEQLNINSFIISATIVAIGTSLPELVTALSAARKKEADIALGNVLGSNIINIFIVLGIGAIIKPIIVSKDVFLDIYILVFLSCFFGIYTYFNKKLYKKTGILFLIIYISYILFVIFRNFI